MITQNELLLWSKWDRNALILAFGKMSLTQWLKLRREMQVALHRYGKTHSMDEVQQSIVTHTKDIEIACWRTFFTFEGKRRMKTEPSFCKLPPQRRKTLIRKEWEALLKRYTY